MDFTVKNSNATRVLVTAASFVVLVAGMKAASPILVPFLLSLLIAIICAPPLFWMLRKGIPNVIAVISILIGIVAMGLLLAAFVGNSVNAFSRALPGYETRLSEMTVGLLSWLQSLGLEVSREALNDYFDPGKILNVAMNTLTRVRGLLTNAFLILLAVIFIMLEASAFPQKLQSALKDPEQSLGRFRTFTASVNRYLAMKTLFSFVTGLFIWIWLSILGVDFALLWGLLAFLFNYVPNIGSIIAAVPAILLSLIQYGMGSVFLLTCLGYAVVNVLVGSIIEPKFMGRGLGLSTLVVFLSLVFWGWVLGPVGMLLSVLLTMIVKIALESNEETRWLAILLG
jgi:predicted PurR-regulated permease PerM